jgi:hypothetical protein
VDPSAPKKEPDSEQRCVLAEPEQLICAYRKQRLALASTIMA